MARGRKNMPAGPGRPKGLPNKSTANAREAIARFVDGNADRLNGWLEEVYVREGPREAFKCFTDLIEYHVPKLARTELTGLNGGAIEHKDVTQADQEILNQYLKGQK